MSNDTPQVPQTGGAQPSIDPNLAMRVMNLYGRIDQVLAELRVPSSERRQVEQNLMEAIAAELLTRLGTKMSDEEKVRLAELTDTGGREPNLADIASFFRDSFSQGDLLQDLGDATESVLNDFVKEMGK